MAHTSSRTSGTPTNRRPPVVGFFFSDLSLAPSNLRFLGSPEIGPGSFIGSPSSVITGPTTSPTTVVFPAATSDSSLLTSSLSGVGSPNTGAIVGGVIGGILIIAIAALGFFYLQRRRKTRRAPSAVFIDVDDEYGPPRFDGARMQLLRDEIHASLPMPEMAMPVTPMAFYVRVFMPSFKLHSRALT